MKNLFILFCITFLPFYIFANIINVPADQPTIQAGINAAVNGDTVLVADSTYYENINFKGKAITVASLFLMDGDTTHIDSTIINGSQPSNPDSGSVVYFISGEDTNSVLSGFTITGGSGTDFVSGSSLRTAGGGIFSYYSGPSICNNIIENNIVYHVTTFTYGGGIYTGPSGSDTYIIIEDNKIQSNTVESVNGIAYGGGIRISSNGRVVRNKIKNNEANCSASSSGGGGIYCFNENIKPYKFVTIKENIITNNLSFSNSSYAKSGGVGLIYTNCFIDSNIISNNTSIGATAGNATGIHIFYTDSVTVVQNNQFLSNTGGGMQVEFSEGITIKNNRFEYNATNSYGGGILEYQCSNTQIIQNEFHGNESRGGGGIFEQECTNTEITENKIIGNTASEFGGALNLYLSTNTKIINNIIAQNSGGNFGGGLVISNSTENTFFGEKFNIGVIYAAEGEDFLNESNQSGQKTSKNNIITQQNSGIEVINNTITQNTAIVGGGIYTEFSDVIVMNTILWGDTATSGLGPEIDIDGGTVDVRYSNIDSMAVFGTINSFSNNINADPLLSDSLFHLSDASLCIAAGVDSIEIGGSWYFCPPYDIYGNPRPDPPGKNPDMGACESPLGNPVGIETSPLEQLPKTYSLNQNYPNPFNPSTTVEFALPHAGFVTLKIYNILGKEVATLVSERLTAGKYEYQWDASREGGVASGVYFYRLQTESDFVQTKKLLLLK